MSMEMGPEETGGDTGREHIATILLPVVISGAARLFARQRAFLSERRVGQLSGATPP